MKVRFTSHNARRCTAKPPENYWPAEPRFFATAPQKNMSAATTRKTAQILPRFAALLVVLAAMAGPPRPASNLRCASKCRWAAPPNFSDAVFGEREFSNDEIEDFVLVRSGKSVDRSAVTVQDEEFGPVHVPAERRRGRRGDVHHPRDSRSRSHFQHAQTGSALTTRALGAEIPIFAHLPLILGADKSRLFQTSWRHRRHMYAPKAFLPEAFRNFLALLGLAPGGDQEFLRTSQLPRKIFTRGGQPHQRCV